MLIFVGVSRKIVWPLDNQAHRLTLSNMSTLRNNAAARNASPELLSELLSSIAPSELYRPTTRANSARSLAALKYKPSFARQERTIRIAAFGSKSRPSAKPHEVRIGKDGNCYCTCRAWTMQALHPQDRVCLHIASIFGIPGFNSPGPRVA